MKPFPEYKHKYVRCRKCKYHLTPKKVNKRVNNDKLKECCFMTFFCTYGLNQTLKSCFCFNTLSFQTLFKSVYAGSLTNLVPRHSVVIKKLIPITTSPFVPQGTVYIVPMILDTNKK